MDLKDFEFVPGVIIDAEDPLKLGRVKCAAPGLFDPDVMDLDILPWISPWNMNKYQNFSKPVKNSKVWILNNKSNYNEFWYCNFFEMIDVTNQFVQEKYDRNVEVIMSRKTIDGSIQITYDDDNGIMLHVNDNVINIQPNGDINIHGGEAEVAIRGGKVYVGSDGGSYTNMVLYDKLQSLFGEMSSLFNQMSTLCIGDASPLKTGFSQLSKKTKNVDEIKSNNAFVN